MTELRYLVVIEGDERTNFSAYAPDLPGCVATGGTRQEVERLMREGIELHIEALREDGEPVPDATAVAATVVTVGSATPTA